MSFLVRYWYVILLAFALSLLSAVGILYLERERWLPEPKPDTTLEEASELPGMSESYLKWNFEISGVEDLRVKMEAEREQLRKQQLDLEVLQGQVQSEMEELARMRDEIDSLREAIRRDIIEISEAEESNVRRLGKMYAEMNPDAAVVIFADLDIELVVKILSRMGEEPASRILAEMTNADPEGPLAQRAARITEMIQKVM